jgi:hypothetical protein
MEFQSVWWAKRAPEILSELYRGFYDEDEGDMMGKRKELGVDDPVWFRADHPGPLVKGTCVSTTKHSLLVMYGGTIYVVPKDYSYRNEQGER